MYIVMEIQKNNGLISTIVTTHETINQAKNKYHNILAYASISNIEKHSACILDEKGASLFSESYVHPGDEE